MKFSCFIAIACTVLVVLDLFRQGPDYGNVLAAGLAAAVIWLAGNHWLSRRLPVKSQQK